MITSLHSFHKEEVRLLNPFKQTHPKKICVLFKSKMTIVKYLFSFSILFALSSCVLFIIATTAKTNQFKNQQIDLNIQMRNKQLSISQLEQDISKEGFELNKETELVNNLSIQYSIIKQKRTGLVMKTGRKYTDDISTFKKLLEDEYNYNEQLQKEISLKESNKTELESKINHIKSEIASLEKKFSDKNISKRDILANSNILNEDYYSLLEEWFSYKKDFNMKLIYQPSSSDDYSSYHFDKAVKDYYNTIIILRLSSQHIIGGFTSQNWKGQGFKYDNEAFLFDLSERKKYSIYDQKKAIYCSKQLFPIFGDGDLMINQNDITSDFPNSYGVSNAGRLELTQGWAKTFRLNFEVYTLDDLY